MDVFEIIQNIGVPAVTAVAGWFASVWRTRQKKEKDVLENVAQILEMQKKYIADQDKENRRTREFNRQLERKLDRKNRSIRQANLCRYTNEGDGCPVLASEDGYEGAPDCSDCEYAKDLHAQPPACQGGADDA